MKTDPREDYLKALKFLERGTHMSFIQFYELALMILQNPTPGAENPEVEQAEDRVYEWCRQFRGPKGVPSPEWVLMQMDQMRIGGKKYLRVRRRKVSKRFTYLELCRQTWALEASIRVMVREASKNVRITSPDSRM